MATQYANCSTVAGKAYARRRTMDRLSDGGSNPPRSTASKIYVKTDRNILQFSTVETYQADVIDASSTRPVVVLIWHESVEAANSVEVTIEDLVSEITFEFDMYKVNAATDFGIPLREDIAAVPAVAVYKNGAMVGKLFRETDRAQIKSTILTAE